MTKALLQITDLRKSFGNLEVLKGLSTDIRPGEVVVMIGPSGGGKSTFLRCMNLLEQPTAWTWCGRTSGRRTGSARRWGWCSSTSTSSRT